MNEFNKGDRISWRYYRLYPGKWRIILRKTGVFIKEIDDKYSLIKLQGNKNPSKKLTDEIVKG